MPRVLVSWLLFHENVTLPKSLLFGLESSKIVATGVARMKCFALFHTLELLGEVGGRNTLIPLRGIQKGGTESAFKMDLKE